MINKLDFVQIKNSDPDINSKYEFLEGFKEALNELNLIKRGKLKGIPTKDLLNEI